MIQDNNNVPAIPDGDFQKVLNPHPEGYSHASIAGYHVVTGGQNRPVALDNLGNEILSRPVGIKPPSYSPRLIINPDGGELNGNYQFAVRRVDRQTGRGSNLSPPGIVGTELPANLPPEGNLSAGNLVPMHLGAEREFDGRVQRIDVFRQSIFVDSVGTVRVTNAGISDGSDVRVYGIRLWARKVGNPEGRLRIDLRRSYNNDPPFYGLPQTRPDGFIDGSRHSLDVADLPDEFGPDGVTLSYADRDVSVPVGEAVILDVRLTLEGDSEASNDDYVEVLVSDNNQYSDGSIVWLRNSPATPNPGTEDGLVPFPTEVSTRPWRVALERSNNPTEIFMCSADAERVLKLNYPDLNSVQGQYVLQSGDGRVMSLYLSPNGDLVVITTTRLLKIDPSDMSLDGNVELDCYYDGPPWNNRERVPVLAEFNPSANECWVFRNGAERVDLDLMEVNLIWDAESQAPLPDPQAGSFNLRVLPFFAFVYYREDSEYRLGAHSGVSREFVGDNRTEVWKFWTRAVVYPDVEEDGGSVTVLLNDSFSFRDYPIRGRRIGDPVSVPRPPEIEDLFGLDLLRRRSVPLDESGDELNFSIGMNAVRTLFRDIDRFLEPLVGYYYSEHDGVSATMQRIGGQVEARVVDTFTGEELGRFLVTDITFTPRPDGRFPPIMGMLVDGQDRVCVFSQTGFRFYTLEGTAIEGVSGDVGENQFRNALIDSNSRWGFVSCITVPGRIVRFDISGSVPEREDVLVYESDESFTRQNCMVMTNNRNFIYAATEENYNGGNTDNAKLLKINVSDFTRVGALEFDSLDAGPHNSPRTVVVSGDGALAYVAVSRRFAAQGNGLGWRVYKVSTSDMTIVGHVDIFGEHANSGLFSQSPGCGDINRNGSQVFFFGGGGQATAINTGDMSIAAQAVIGGTGQQFFFAKVSRTQQDDERIYLLSNTGSGSAERISAFVTFPASGFDSDGVVVSGVPFTVDSGADIDTEENYLFFTNANDRVIRVPLKAELYPDPSEIEGFSDFRPDLSVRFENITDVRGLAVDPSGRKIFLSSNQSPGRVGLISSNFGSPDDVDDGEERSYDVLFEMIPSPSVSGDNVYFSIEEGRVEIDTSRMSALEPESMLQGGTESFDRLQIMVRELSTGSEWRRVAEIEIGESFSYNEEPERLLSKVSFVDGFHEAHGGWEHVETYVSDGVERLVWAGKVGFDMFSPKGLGGTEFGPKDISFLIRKDPLVLPPQIGETADITSDTITFPDGFVDNDVLEEVEAGDWCIFVDGEGRVGYFRVTLNDFPNSVLEYEDEVRHPSDGPSSMFGTFVRLVFAHLKSPPRVVGVVDSVDGEDATIDVTSQEALESLVAGRMVVFETDTGVVVRVVSEVDYDAGVVTIPVGQTLPVGVGDSVLSFYGLGFAELSDGHVLRAVRNGDELCRAWLVMDTNGAVVPHRDFDREDVGFTGNRPDNFTEVVISRELLGSVQPGDRFIRLHTDEFGSEEFDFAQQCFVQFEGVTARGRVKKNLLYRIGLPSTQEVALPVDAPMVELETPWDGPAVARVPIYFLEDNTSIWVGGISASPSTHEAISGLLRYEMNAASGIGLLRQSRGRLVVIGRRDEAFIVQVASFDIPIIGQTALLFAIESEIRSEKVIGSFTCVSKRLRAVDNDGRLFFLGGEGLYIFDFSSILLAPGMRKFFHRIAPDSFRLTGGEFDPAAFPFLTLRIMGLNKRTGGREMITYMPDIHSWGVESDVLSNVVAKASKQSGGAVSLSAGSGRVLIQGNTTGEDGELDSYFVNGQVDVRARRKGVVTYQDFTFDADPVPVWRLDVGPEDMRYWRDALNCLKDDDDFVFTAMKSGVKLVVTREADGESRDFDIIGLDSQEGVVWFEDEDGFEEFLEEGNYWWAVGARKWAMTTGERRPSGGYTAHQVTRLDLDIETGGNEDDPVWVVVEVVGAAASNDRETSPLFRRVISWARFRESRISILGIRHRMARSVAVRLSGYAPSHARLSVKKMDVTYFEGMI